MSKLEGGEAPRTGLSVPGCLVEQQGFSKAGALSTEPPGPETAWRVLQGYVDLFAQPLDPATGEQGRRTHLLRVDAGNLMVGLPVPVDHGLSCLRLLAVASLEATIERFPFADIVGQFARPDPLDRWVRAIFAHGQDEAKDRAARVVQAGELVELAPGETITGSADPLWLADLDAGAAHSAYLLLLPNRHHRSAEAAVLRSLNTAAALAADPVRLMRTLEHEHVRCLLSIAGRLANDAQVQQDHLVRRRRVEGERIAGALAELGAVLDPAVSDTQIDTSTIADPSARAIERVLAIFGEEVRHPPSIPFAPDEAPVDRIERLASACHLRGRRVLLSGTWWKQDRGVLIAFGIDDAQAPVVLRPVAPNQYELIRGNGEISRLSRRTAHELRVEAVQFYRSFLSGPVGLAQVFRMSRPTLVASAWTFLLTSLLTGLLALAPPLAIAFLFDTVLPHAEVNMLLDVAIGIAVIALGAACFGFTKAIALVRLENGISLAFEAALVDRLLRLPVKFFAAFTSGDLVTRMLAISEIRRTLAGRGMVILLELLFSGFSVALLFFIDPELAALAAMLLVIAFLLAVALNLRALGFETTAIAEHGRLEGLTVQLAIGISKLRVAAAERQAMGAWTRVFTRQQQQLRQAQSYRVALQVLTSALPTAGLIVLFVGASTIGNREDGALPAGAFMAFNAAFGALLGVLLAVSTELTTILRSVPLYHRAYPLLKAETEGVRADGQTASLRGKIELHNVRFGYAEDGPPVVDGLSLTVKSGEYLAIVGPSGSGKSTLFRLLLGFERAQSGAILFDGVSQDRLDLTSLRRGMGIVLQQSRISPGNLFQNIVGSSGLGLEDAWRAARLAGLADDIEALPMGMHTPMTENGQGLSGGQRQRLLIARALVHHPTIVLFDEATSALDNRTQAVVTSTIAGLQATRIVIAHRLSTIQRADRIAVLDHGKLVQIGVFSELISTEGPFQALAQRQLL